MIRTTKIEALIKDIKKVEPVIAKTPAYKVNDTTEVDRNGWYRQIEDKN